LSRDVKGLYKRALAGEIESFTGVSDPYEAPLRPEIYINSEAQSEAESIRILISRLQQLGFLPNQDDFRQSEIRSA
jgi:adenylylsulfate kinase-like enzyme